MQALSAGIENLSLLDKELQNKIKEASGKDNVGIKEFEAWMRMLDSQVAPWFEIIKSKNRSECYSKVW